MTTATNLLIVCRGCSISSPRILQLLVDPERDYLDNGRCDNTNSQGLPQVAAAFEGYTYWVHVTFAPALKHVIATCSVSLVRLACTRSILGLNMIGQSVSDPDLHPQRHEYIHCSLTSTVGLRQQK